MAIPQSPCGFLPTLQPMPILAAFQPFPITLPVSLNMNENRPSARPHIQAYGRYPSPSVSSLGSYGSVASRSETTLASRAYSRGFLQRDALLSTVAVGRTQGEKHRFPGLKPKKGKTPVKRTIESRKASIAVSGLPPGLATMLVAEGKAKDVGGQTFHYPTMLMLRILRTKGRRQESRTPTLPRERSSQLSTVHLELDVDYQSRSAPRCKSVPRPRPSLDTRCKPSVHKPLESLIPPDLPPDLQSVTPREDAVKPELEKTTRKTIFMRKEGCVCYSIPSLQDKP